MGSYLLVFITYWRRSILLFDGSILSISKSKHIILTLLTVLLILLFILSLITSLIWDDSLLSGLVIALFCLLYIVAVLFLSYLVFRGMKMLLKAQENAVQGRKTRIIQDQIMVTTKITILVIVSTLTTVITFLSLMVVGTHKDGWLYSLFQSSFDTLINNICLYMQFEFAHGWYTKWCNWLHNYFENKYLVTNRNDTGKSGDNHNNNKIGGNNRNGLIVDNDISMRSMSPSVTSTVSQTTKSTAMTEMAV